MLTHLQVMIASTQLNNVTNFQVPWQQVNQGSRSQSKRTAQDGKSIQEQHNPTFSKRFFYKRLLAKKMSTAPSDEHPSDFALPLTETIYYERRTETSIESNDDEKSRKPKKK